MPDPVDWGNVIESPQIWGSVLVFIAAMVTQWVLYRNNTAKLKAELESKSAELAAKKEESDLAAIQATVAVLRSEYERLNGEVKELREKVETSEKRYRKLTEKYSTAIAYIFTLITLFGPTGQKIPPAPDLIAEDMTPLPE